MAHPNDRIMVTEGAPELPLPLVDQVAGGGRIVVPIGLVGHKNCCS
ncbi:MAG TPA: hypothetical protein QGI07_09990 [Dehalococcoidia bacterium]|jgi:protein-L-isoaspartate(D-aspartate) O-methyltransferase|nr:hypothetical protein [Dehalococcoidia bacterium]MDP6272435.1 hypothetical protein [Dehalococcoidia bacterium]MDP7160805.1 hypothetical protein [Dehalococcoidia bacterium]MDP7213266.1 hypothetical protein [Dehalococcoidia bacterium]MDP7513969.1 hypothetical protein [Dehalococcoidia bacterium]|tara:strand:+ start:861 stop:998 length:138 start_codon:yes stop_codon:yes gene_type:complete